ncbi:MAG: hypothetical protein JXQ76_03315, partial [Campylobacterales bacterium]|nr:hypothetical protein [Campylobacterales bacterium]
MSDIYKIDELVQKCEKLYTKGELFRAYIQGEELFPWSLNLKKLKQSDIQKDYNDITQSIEKLQNKGFGLEYQSFNFKSMGMQKLPIKIVFNSIDDFFKIIPKAREYQSFCKLYDKLHAKYSTLQKLFSQHPFWILEYQEVWDEILSVIEFLLANPNPTIYLRELSLSKIDTKFIEKYKKIIDRVTSHIQNQPPLSSLSHYAFEQKYCFKYPQLQIRFRILDKRLYIQNLSNLSLPLNDFKELNFPCKTIYIVENKITTLSFPNLKDSIVIFGQGYGVSALKEIEWFRDKTIYYSTDKIGK